MISSGVMWSSEIKDGLLEIHDMTLFDAMGSTEGGIVLLYPTEKCLRKPQNLPLIQGLLF